MKIKFGKPRRMILRLKACAGIAVVAALAGCIGYVDGGYYDDGWWVAGPDMFIFGGIEAGHAAHGWGHRGAGSHGAAHSGGGSFWGGGGNGGHGGSGGHR